MKFTSRAPGYISNFEPGGLKLVACSLTHARSDEQRVRFLSRLYPFSLYFKSRLNLKYSSPDSVLKMRDWRSDRVYITSTTYLFARKTRWRSCRGRGREKERKKGRENEAEWDSSSAGHVAAPK